MQAYINPPKKLPWYIRLGVYIGKLITGKELLPAKLLAWFPRAAIASGIFEISIAGEKDMDGRLLKLFRLQCSLTASCPFCFDMNSVDAQKYNITEEEFKVLQKQDSLNRVSSFEPGEKLALEYARKLSSSPISILPEFINELKKHYTEKEIVILAYTAAQVNYWARLIQGLGVPPAGFTDRCTTNI